MNYDALPHVTCSVGMHVKRWSCQGSERRAELRWQIYLWDAAVIQRPNVLRQQDRVRAFSDLRAM